IDGGRRGAPPFFVSGRCTSGRWSRTGPREGGAPSDEVDATTRKDLRRNPLREFGPARPACWGSTPGPVVLAPLFLRGCLPPPTWLPCTPCWMTGNGRTTSIDLPRKRPEAAVA